MSQAQLRQTVLAHSRSREWEQALAEWHLESVRRSDEPETCVCGHHPIFEVCTIANGATGHTLDAVGSCCVVQFMGERSDLVLHGLERAAGGGALNAAALDFARRRGWLTGWEFGFYSDTMRKRSLTPKQSAVRDRVNAKVAERVEEERARSELKRFRARFGLDAALDVLRSVGQARNVAGMDPALYGAVIAACRDPLNERWTEA